MSENRVNTPVISGIGESEFSRRSDKLFGELQLSAIEAALADAGLTPADIDGVFTDSHVMPTLFPIDAVRSAFGMQNIENIGYYGLGGTGIGYAAMEAANVVRSGQAKAVLVYFGVDWGSLAAGPYAFHDRYPAKHWFERPYGYYGQPLYFAGIARRYAYQYGLTMDELTDGLGHLAVGQRANALKNPKSQMRTALTLEDYHQGRMIVDPLRVYDCCLISDGAGAFVVTSEERACDKSAQPVVKVLGGAYAADPTRDEAFFSQAPEYPSFPSAGRSAKRAFARAGVSPADIDFLQVYDCFTMSVVVQLEQLGVCGLGEGLEVIKKGTTVDSPGLPINTHGGLLSQSYLLGINHMTEAVRQLRGDAGAGQVPGAEVGAVSLSPGSDHVTLILGRG